MENKLSYSQISTYMNCKHKWKLNYVDKIRPFSGSIFTLFGTAIHETLQEYLTVLFNDSVKKANQIDLDKLLKDRMMINYNHDFKVTKEQMMEIYCDGTDIIEYFLKHRNKYFSTREWELVEIEGELETPITNNIYFGGFLDVILRNKQTKKIKIIDFKSSYNSWNDKKKKDERIRMQLGLYKYFYAKQFNVDIKDIDVEFMILKRKVYDKADWPIPRIQIVKPPTGTGSLNKHIKVVSDMITESFNDEGKHILKEYETNKSVSNCKWCEFKKTEHCKAWK